MQICITKDMIAKKAIDHKYLTVLKGLNKTLHGRTPAEAYNHLKEDFEHRVLTSPANNRQYSKLCEYPRHLKQIDSDGELDLDAKINVLRYYTKDESGKKETHALIPFFIVPYNSFSLQFIMLVLFDYFVRQMDPKDVRAKYALSEKQFRGLLKTYRENRVDWYKTILTEEERRNPRKMFEKDRAFFEFVINYETFDAFECSFLENQGNGPRFYFLEKYRRGRHADFGII